MISKIIVPTDGSVFSRRATDMAIEIAKAMGSTVIAVNVIEIKPPNLLEASTIEKLKLKRTEMCFKDFEDEAKSAGIVLETKLLISRNIINALLNEINLHNPDLVIMGSHGLKGIKKFILGSVAEDVLNKSPVPVLIVK
jgi:nucleotide-binding universal stress UspA family protein